MIYRVYFLINDFPNGIIRRSKDFKNGREALSFAKDVKKDNNRILAYLEFIDSKKVSE